MVMINIFGNYNYRVRVLLLEGFSKKTLEWCTVGPVHHSVDIIGLARSLDQSVCLCVCVCVCVCVYPVHWHISCMSIHSCLDTHTHTHTHTYNTRASTYTHVRKHTDTYTYTLTTDHIGVHDIMIML